MKIFTPEGTELMVIDSVAPSPEGIVVAGTIMGAMPLKGVIRPAELRAARRFLSARLVWAALRMLLGR